MMEKLIPQSEADAMVAAAYEDCRDIIDNLKPVGYPAHSESEKRLERTAQEDFAMIASEALEKKIPEPAAKALAELIDKRDQEWINAIGAEDLEPRRPVNIKNLVAWFCDSCMSGPLGDIKKLEADNAALRAEIQQIEADDRLVQAETNKMIEKYEEDLAKLKSQIASADRRGRLEEARSLYVELERSLTIIGRDLNGGEYEHLFTHAIMPIVLRYPHTRIATLESAQSPKPEREGEL